MFTILTIDDEENIRNGLADNFELEGYAVEKAANGKEGLDLIAKGGIDLVITDLRMDGISGEEVVRQITTKYPGIPIIVLTGHGSIDDATAAIKSGAFDFLTKPLDLDHLNLVVKNALKGREQSLKITELQERLRKNASPDEMIGKSAELNRVRAIIQKAAPTKASVLITGESGVGKELVAKASVTAYHLIAAPTSITTPDKRAVKRTPILSSMIPAKIKKNTKTFKNVSDPCIVPKAVESHPRVSCIKSLIGDKMSIKIYEQNMAKANNSKAIHLIAALSLNVAIFSVIFY